MSSHHIVKEGQEPALIIGNGEACSFSLLNEFLEWSPFVVALDGAFQRVQALGIEPDLVIGDFDSIEIPDDRPDILFIKIDRQDNTDLEKAIDHLSEKGVTDINILWATGNRLDHTVNNLSTLAKYDALNLVMYDDLNKIFLLPKRYEKFHEAGDPISLIPMGIVEGVHTEGLKYNLNDESLIFSERTGSSNFVLDKGTILIEHKKGKLILMESYDRESL